MRLHRSALHRGISIALGVAWSISMGGASAAAESACRPPVLLTAIEMKFDGAGRPALPVQLDRREKILLLDTGAAMSALNRNVFEELGYPLRVSGSITNHAATGFTSNQFGVVREVSIAGIQTQEHAFFVSPDGTLGHGALAGVLGGEFLQTVDVDLNFGTGIVSFFRPGDCPGYVENMIPQPATVVPFDFRERSIAVPVTVDGETLTGVLDTGATGTYMNLLVAQRTFAIDVNDPSVELTGEIAGTSRAAIYRKRFNALQVEDIKIATPMITLWPDLAPEWRPGLNVNGNGGRLNFPEVLLGMSALSKFRVYIAYRERKVFLAPLNGSLAAP